MASTTPPPTHRDRLPGERLLLAFLAGAVLLDVLFWTLWFTARDLVASSAEDWYVIFENAFPAPDAWLGFACAAAFLALRARRDSAVFWLACAGSAAAYLFLIDVLFDLQNGIYALGAAAIGEICINVLSLALAVLCLRFAHRHRRGLG